MNSLENRKNVDDPPLVEKRKMMLNKFENYQQHQCGSGMSSLSSAATTSTAVCSADYAAAAAAAAAVAAAAAAASKAERESIHSGQFMVSHFEAEEAQDDLEDVEVKMLDPEDPSLSKCDEPNPCMEVQLFVPQKMIKFRKDSCSSAGLVTSHLEIETSLTKLFKCMNLAYSQKLTSPKWNHFKGVRLRWKDKIRLNNVIWRCWHMQFILKRKTPVCQFASPLDVDIHINPQNVVLEGKYWKRQFGVIKAEYRKWRRNSKSKATGFLANDTRSEFDFLEWSPFNDKSLMILEDWTSDTLFSAINGPFPFPDSREIARGAGIADFIQPSLGPLQPNLEEIDITFEELLENARLPSVPEEGTDDMLKNVDYGFSAIMGPDQMDSSNIMDVTLNSVNQMQQNNDDTNMLELNTPLNTMQFADIEQQFTSRGNALIMGGVGGNDGQSSNRGVMSNVDAMMTDERTLVLLTEATATSPTNNRNQTKHYSSATDNVLSRQNSNEYPNKSVIKGRISKNFQRPFRREPHNYDKAQPTLHQTTIYQQMLAEQQKNNQQNHHQHLQPTINVNALQHQASTFQHQQQQQQQQQMQYSSASQFPHSPPNMIGGGNNNYGYNTDATSSNINSNILSMSAGNGGSPEGYGLMPTTQVSSTSSTTCVAQPMMLNVKIEPPSPDVLSMFNLSNANDVYGGSVVGSNNSNSYKPYPNLANFKKSASTGNYINIRAAQSVNQGYIQDQQQSSPAHSMHSPSLNLSMAGQMPTLSLQVQSVPITQLSPPASSHQQQQQQHHHLHQQQQHQQQQHHLQQQQAAQAQAQLHQSVQQSSQPQQQQQQQQSIMPKEMFRSNSLPLNVSLQKLEARLSHDNFAVPKYHAKSSKPRSRSNSIHQHHAVANNSNGSGNNNSASNLLVSQQLQAATSDPMLNSTLAQLLTTNTRMTSLAKQQSSSTSAISNIIVPMTTLPMSPVSGAKSMQQTTIAAPGGASSIYMSPAQSSSSSSSGAAVTSTSSQTTQHGFGQRQMQQQKSPKKSTSLPTPAAPQMLHSPPASKMLSYPPTAGTQINCTNNLSLSPDSFHDQDSPLSPTHSLKFPRDNQRRAGHIHAEQKRRYNIKNGFDILHSLIPQLQQNPNAKLSKAAMLQKGADHIKHLRTERNLLKERMEALRQERDTLNNSLTHLHSILPANGAPVTRQGTENVRQLYEQYVGYRTMNNWKFWILGLILEPMLTSYTSSVSSASMEELRRTAYLWVDQHCSLIDLRPAVSNKLKYLSMKTDILSDPPSTLQEEVGKALQNTTGQHPNLHGT